MIVQSIPYPAAAGDPNFANVGLLANLNEGAGGTPLDYSSSPKTITLNGGLSLVSGSPPSWQSSSLSFDNSNDFASVPDSADFAFGSGDFTIEYFMLRDSVQVDAVIGQWSSSSGRSFAIFESGNLANELQFFYSTNGTNSTGIIGVMSGNVGSWSHRAVSRVGSNIYLCQGGTILTASAFTATLNDSTLSLIMGANNGASAFLGAQLANVRITKGVGRYSGTAGSSYTVPTAPYPTS